MAKTLIREVNKDRTPQSQSLIVAYQCKFQLDMALYQILMHHKNKTDGSETDS